MLSRNLETECKRILKRITPNQNHTIALILILTKQTLPPGDKEHNQGQIVSLLFKIILMALYSAQGEQKILEKLYI